MINFFSRRQNNTHAKWTPPTLQNLDKSLYPLYLQGMNSWQNRQTEPAVKTTFATPQELLCALIDGHINADPYAYWQILHNSSIYQQWINFTVFGRYIQRSFSIFYQQNQDDFNTDMPELLRHELMRHVQHLPIGQTLFFAGKLTAQARQEKLLITTLNPCTAYNNMMADKKGRARFINQVLIKSNKVAAFAIKHNKHTSDRLRCEVMILNFKQLRLVKEKDIMPVSTDAASKALPTSPVTLRTYELY